MTADQVLHIDTIERQTLWGSLLLQSEVCYGINSTSTTDENLALILRVKVNQVLSGEHTLAEVKSTCKTSLLIDGEESLQRSVLRLLIQQQSHRSRHTDTVVSSERRTLGTYPLAIHNGTNSVVLEVELHIAVLLANHIHMRLQDNRWARLITRRCRLTHHDITYLIALPLDIVGLRKLNQKLNHTLLLLRWAWYSGEGIKLLPHGTGL